MAWRHALDLLEEVGFERDAFVAYKAAGALPQGYLKRLELAKVIALQPDLFILDELFSGLSLAEVASIVPIIEKIRLTGKTIIMIEHRLKELFRIADRVIVLNFGEVIAVGSPTEVSEHPELFLPVRALAPGESDSPVGVLLQRLHPYPRVLQNQRVARELGQERDPEIGIHHLDQGQHAARPDAAHLLRVADLAGGKGMVAQAMAVREQQDAVGIEPVVLHVE